MNVDDLKDDEPQRINKIQRRGAMYALTEIILYFGAELPQKLPKLWELIVGQLAKTVDLVNFAPASGKDKEAEQLVWDLQVLEVAAPSVHEQLLPELIDSTLERLCVLLSHPYRAVRHLSSRCLAVFANIDSVKVMELVVSKVSFLIIFYLSFIKQSSIYVWRPK